MSEIIKNCENCALLGADGDEPERSFAVCKLTYCNSDDEDDITNKPGFPFQTEQPCHVPGFWQYLDKDSELAEMFDKEMIDVTFNASIKTNDYSYDKTYHRFVEKYGIPLKKKCNIVD